jgi:hypothetical protein
MRGAWTAVLGLVVWACGGRVEEEATDASFPMDAATTIVDASTSDTSYEVDCVPTASDPTGCPGGGYCVVWLSAAAAAKRPALFPDAGLVRSACETGPLTTICDGSPSNDVSYNTYANTVAWVVCAEP